MHLPMSPPHDPCTEICGVNMLVVALLVSVVVAVLVAEK